MTSLVSPCCGAAVRTYHEMTGSYGDWGDRLSSNWYVCAACSQPCDPVPSEPGKAMEGE